MEKESIPNLEMVPDDSDQRLIEADSICESLLCVCADEFSRVESEFLSRMAEAEYVSESQLDWMRKIQTKFMARIL